MPTRTMRYEQLIRKHFEVVSVSGDEFLCKCAFHQDGGKPNLYVNGVRGVYMCHACGATGHMKNITKDLPQLDTDDIRERLARLRAMEEDDPGGTVYPESWLKRFAFSHDYWSRRGLSDDIVERFQLGYDPMTDRLTIPLRSPSGQLLGVIQRVLTDDKPKYRYPKGFPVGKNLFAQWLVDGRRRKVALVEGSLDAIKCWDARVPALALLGARLTDDQRDVLLRMGIDTVAIFTDNDRAGRAAIEQVHDKLAGSGIAVKVCQYRPYWNAKDPGELRPDQIRKAYHSAVAWHRWVAAE